MTACEEGSGVIPGLWSIELRKRRVLSSTKNSARTHRKLYSVLGTF